MGATTLYSFPYPGTGDPPHGPNQTQALAESVETKIASLEATLSGRLIARGTRNSVSSLTSGSTVLAVMRISGIAVAGGRSYRLSYTTTPKSTVAGDGVIVEVRYTTNATDATTSSSVMPGSQTYNRAVVSDAGHSTSTEWYYAPGSTQTLSLLLCVKRESGTGQASLYADATAITELTIDDRGLPVADTGTDL